MYTVNALFKLHLTCHLLLRHPVKALSIQPIHSKHCSFYFRVLFAKFFQRSKYFVSVGDNKISIHGVLPHLWIQQSSLLLVLYSCQSCLRNYSRGYLSQAVQQHHASCLHVPWSIFPSFFSSSDGRYAVSSKIYLNLWRYHKSWIN